MAKEIIKTLQVKPSIVPESLLMGKDIESCEVVAQTFAIALKGTQYILRKAQDGLNDEARLMLPDITSGHDIDGTDFVMSHKTRATFVKLDRTLRKALESAKNFAAVENEAKRQAKHSEKSAEVVPA